jgi:pimeloyl-ACP methyl ester carboxylesterase
MRFAILVLSAATLACSLLSNREDSYAVANGQTLHYTCRGDASKPTVLFESAIGGDESLWKIADRVSDRAYACTYDRAGNGRSNKPTQALTARDHVDQLHALLAAAHIKAPVVFVGHSYGGLVGYLLALVHPEDVSALALVDASHPQQEGALPCCDE